jgi:hypothetical protein
MKQVWITMWGDDGAPCDVFSVLPTMQVYAEFCWTGDVSEKHLEKRMKTTTGASYKDFLALETPNFVPGRDNNGEIIANPVKYMFYQDVLSGKFDRHIPDGCDKHFADTAKLLSRLGKRNPEYGYIFDTLSKLCSALEIKASLGVKIKAAYDAKDKAALGRIAKTKLPELIERTGAYYDALRFQWMKDNKSSGFELMDNRIGGLIQREKNVKITLDEYLSGKTDSIPELEVERIPFDPDFDGKAILHVHSWSAMFSSNSKPW